jgi:hypothetical protein
MHDLVFPKISLAADRPAPRPSSTFQTRLPALRGALDCSMLFPERIVNIRWSSDNTFRARVNVSTGCGEKLDAEDNATNWADATVSNMNNGSYFGFFKPLTKIYGAVSSGCPPLITVYGRVNDTSVNGINIATCFPCVDQVEVNTTFSLPAFDLMSTAVDVSSTRVFTENLSHVHLDIAAALPSPGPAAHYHYDNVFSVLVHGSSKVEPTAITDFMGAKNFPRLSTALSRLYRTVLVQKLSLKTRINTPPPPSADLHAVVAAATSPRIPGTLNEPDRVRLQQSLASTRIIDRIIIAMIICTALSFFLMKTDKVLPINPCSIAASASLLAGSRLVNPESGVLPSASEWHDDKMLKVSKLFQASTFSLKWWQGKKQDGNGDQIRYGIDIDEEPGKSHGYYSPGDIGQPNSNNEVKQQ